MKRRGESKTSPSPSGALCGFTKQVLQKAKQALQKNQHLLGGTGKWQPLPSSVGILCPEAGTGTAGVMTTATAVWVGSGDGDDNSDLDAELPLRRSSFGRRTALSSGFRSGYGSGSGSGSDARLSRRTRDRAKDCNRKCPMLLSVSMPSKALLTGFCWC
jgi:hypothetical protein